MSNRRRPTVLQGNDALNKMIDIYLNGFISGAASAVRSIAPDQVPDEFVDNFAEHLTAGLRNDPLGIETIRREIAEELAGVDSGTKSWNVPGATS